MKKKILFFAAMAVLAIVVSGCGAKKTSDVETLSNNASDAPKVPMNSFAVSQEPVPQRTPTPVKPKEPVQAPTTPQISSSTPSVAVASSAPVSAPVPPAEQTVQIEIKDFSFNPAEVTVVVGSTVVWTNKDAISHDIKSNAFNSPLLDTGKTFEKKFTSAGTYDYNCGIHPSMTGKIIVK